MSARKPQFFCSNDNDDMEIQDGDLIQETYPPWLKIICWGYWGDLETDAAGDSFTIPLALTRRTNDALALYADVIRGAEQKSGLNTTLELCPTDVSVRKLFGEGVVDERWHSVCITARSHGVVACKIVLVADNGMPALECSFELAATDGVQKWLNRKQRAEKLKEETRIVQTPMSSILLCGAWTACSPGFFAVVLKDDLTKTLSLADGWEPYNWEDETPRAGARQRFLLMGPTKTLAAQRKILADWNDIGEYFVSDIEHEIVSVTKDSYLQRPFPGYRCLWPFLHAQLLTFCMCFPDMPQYPILWIVDWLPGMQLQGHRKKLNTIIAMLRSIAAVHERRDERKRIKI